MNYCFIFNRLIIVLYLVNVFVPFTTSLWPGGMKFDADDDDKNWGMKSGKSPATSDSNPARPWDEGRSHSRSRSRSPSVGSSASSRSHKAKTSSSSQKVSLTVAEMENAFYDMYNTHKDEVRWDIVVNRDYERMTNICTAAWENSTGKICEAEPKLYRGERNNGLKVQFHHDHEGDPVRADFIQCKCHHPNMSRDKVRALIPGGSEYDAEDVDKNFRIGSSKSPPWDRERSRSPSERSNNSSDTVPKTLEKIEQEFIDMYSNYSVDVMWDIVINNDTKRMIDTCIAAWKISAARICETEPKPYIGKKNALKAYFRRGIKPFTIRTDFLKCRCWPVEMTRIKNEIKPIYLAKYNESTVFLLKQLGNPHYLNLEIFGMKHI